QLQQCETQNRKIEGLESTHLAYVIYTSGSTGKPKGVMVEHQAFASHIDFCQQHYRISEEERILQFSTINFDAAQEQIFSSLLQGAALYLRARDHLSSNEFIDFLYSNQITFADIPPGYFQKVFSSVNRTDHRLSQLALKTFVLGGESFNYEIVHLWKKLPFDAALFNAYGPTEAVVTTSLYLFSKNQSVERVAIGKSNLGRKYYVLNNGQLAPKGSSGELYIGGSAIARGYLNQPELTAERFVENPFATAQEKAKGNTRLYKTGDLVRYLPDGNLEFIGRADEQVKIRGFRIELGEIETHLSKLEGILAATVLVVENEYQNKHLVGYIIPESNVGDENTWLQAIKKELSKSLPDYMVPSAFLLLEEWPLTPNGKIDQKILARKNVVVSQGEYDAPETTTEYELVSIFAKLLNKNLEAISRTANFFELGGHSLLAIRLVAMIKAQFNINVPLKSVFESPTITSMSALLDEADLIEQPIVITPITRDKDGELLSFSQQRLWLLDKLQGGSTEYNMPVALHVDGLFDIKVANQAMQRVIKRHEVLRTVLVERDKGTMQVIREQVDFSFVCKDLSMLAGEKQVTAIKQLIDENASTVFELSKDVMVRGVFIKLSTGAEQPQGIVLFNMHHIASDGWSMGVLIKEFSVLYTAFKNGEDDPLAPLSIQYADYAHWQRNWLKDEVLANHLDYWTKQLAGLPIVHGLPLDRARPKKQSFVGAIYHGEVSSDVLRKLKNIYRQSDSTLFMALHAVFSVLLSRYSNETDIVVGSPIANREQEEVANLIGFFVNTLVLRSDLSNNPSFNEVLAQSKRTLLDAYTYQQVPFEKLVEVLQPERSLSHSPLFQVTLVLQNNDEGKLELPDLTLNPIPQEGDFVKYDLTLVVTESETNLQLEWKYNTDLFNAETVERLASHFELLMTGMVNTPEADVYSIDILSSEEVKQQLIGWSNHVVNYPQDVCIQTLFEQQVKANPQAIAVVADGNRLTYSELNQRANQLAHYLIEERSVTPDTLVGICVERSLDMIVGIIGILKAGGAYVPLDPEYPASRLSYMLNDSSLTTVLTQCKLKGETSIPESLAVFLDSEELKQHLAKLVTENLSENELLLKPHNLAYVIYTSGSMGEPKGVLVPHNSLVASTLARINYYTQKTKSFLLLSSLSFDSSVAGIFGTLSCGGQLTLPNKEALSNLQALSNLISEQSVDSLLTVPSFYKEILNVAKNNQGKIVSLKYVILAGEPLPPTVAKEHFEFFNDNCQLVNEYGPTEATVWASCYTVTPTDLNKPNMPIGKSPSLGQLFVLDKHMKTLPLGVAGELYIGGVALTRGYLNRNDLTEEKFVKNPFFNESDTTSSKRLYKTGDLVRYLPDGNLEFLGRIDHQVKIRGFRVELGEIENQLLIHDGVNEAVIIALDSEVGGGDKRLVAYVTMDDVYLQSPETADSLRVVLSKELPDYMVPSAIVVLMQFPLTPNGKIDRKSLPQPDMSERKQTYIAPTSVLEKRLCMIWQEVLGVERVGITDNFFALGGQSLLAIRVVNKIQAITGEVVHVVILHDKPTITELDDYLKKNYTGSLIEKGLLNADNITLKSGLEGGLNDSHFAQVQQLVPSVPKAIIGPNKKNGKAIFILSPHRSGSTLLRVMLAGHPELFSPPDLELLSFDTLKQRNKAFTGRFDFYQEGALRAVMEAKGCSLEEAKQVMAEFEEKDYTIQQFYREIQGWIDGLVLVDKSPTYAYHPEILQQAEKMFEEAHFIHLIRHPYGMITSAEQVKLNVVAYLDEHEYDSKELGELLWAEAHSNISTFLEEIPQSRQHRVVFEDLVKDPARQMESLCEFLSIDYDRSLINPYDDTAKRMSDGVHEESRMLGDGKFLGHKKIKGSVGDAWKQQVREDFLHKRTWELAQKLGYKKPVSKPEYPSIEPVEREGNPLELSFAQQRLWMLDKIDDGSAHYNIPVALTIRGELKLTALINTINTIVARHESLRTNFVDGGHGEPVQRVHVASSLDMPVSDISLLEKNEKQIVLSELIASESSKAFSLKNDLMLRAQLAKVAEKEHVLLITMHHIASDGWSMGVLVRELSALYNAYVSGNTDPLAPMQVQYADYAHWQRNWLQGEVLEEQLAYWEVQLTDIPPVHSLALDHPRPKKQTFAGAVHQSAVNAQIYDEFKALYQQKGCTLFMGLHAAFSVLLSRYSNEVDIVVGSPIANREQAEVAGLIGFFVNTLVLRSDLSNNPSFNDLLVQSKETLLDAYAHQQIPFEKLVETLRPERSLSYSPLFQVALVLQNNEVTKLELSDLDIQLIEQEDVIAKYDLTLSVIEREEGLLLDWEYNTDLFKAETIEGFAKHFDLLLAELVHTPDACVFDVNMLPTESIKRQVVEWNDTACAYPQDALIHTLFEAQVEKTPDATAVVFEGESLSYSELNTRANQLSDYLVTTRQVGPDSLVGICVERSMEMVVGILGILKAGGAYVPLDPAYPSARLGYMIEDAKLTTIVTHEAIDTDIPITAAQRVDLDSQDIVTQLQQCETQNRKIEGLESTHLAYVIYTSGSTGKPKGVMLEHRSVVNYLQNTVMQYGDTQISSAIVSTSLSFDATVTSLFGAWIHGNVLTLLPPNGFIAEQLTDILQREACGMFKLTPAHLASLVLSKPLPNRHVIVVGGEQLTREAALKMSASLPNAIFINEYGPTEATVGCSYSAFTHDSLVTEHLGNAIHIGRPVKNARFYVLDRHRNLLPQGATGELYIGGDGLARGYLAQSALTAERFIDNPYANAQDKANGHIRLYKTGDLVRYLPDGNLAFVGRIDEQVKIRGFRIELGEIEAQLSTLAGVSEAQVLACEDHTLVGYVIPAESVEDEDAYLRDIKYALQQLLPDYMVPSAWVLQSQWPLTANGKIDKRALERMDISHLQSDYVAPQTEMEILLCDIWKDVLQQEQISTAANFFELGGHSLLVMKVISEVQRAGFKLSANMFFETAQLSELAEVLAAQSRSEQVLYRAPANGIPAICNTITPQMLPLVSLTQDNIEHIAQQIPGGMANIQDIYPLGPLQEGILFAHMLSEAHDPYVIPLIFEIKQRSMVEALLSALTLLVSRHDILRTAILWEGLDAPVQVVCRDAAPSVEWLAAEADIMAQLTALSGDKMSLTQAPLFQMRVVASPNDERCVALLEFHHIISDHVGLEIIQ
ncbi:non-ribosomal peptide synthetase, partial [Pseudoalteromonas holothuriae]|uniref:non-ribosomal peptide synthetase n=1 Tax=Pseudoalteromonas holothuriae TaxID=2963714 RepID=UPI0021BEE243